jgi:hypothetical protein
MHNNIFLPIASSFSFARTNFFISLYRLGSASIFSINCSSVKLSRSRSACLVAGFANFEPSFEKLFARLSTEEGFFIFPGDGLLRCLELERERVGVKSRKEKVPGTVSLILVRLGVRVLSLDLPRPLLGVANLK